MDVNSFMPPCKKYAFTDVSIKNLMSLNNFTVPNFTPIKQKSRKWDKFINALNKSMPFTVPIFVELNLP